MKRTSVNAALKIAIWKSGLTQVALAKKFGLSEWRLSRIINGHEAPTPEEAKALAGALKSKVNQLFPEAIAS